MSWKEIQKFLVALLGAAAIAVTQGLVTGTAAKWVAVAIALAASVGVYIVPNALKADTPPSKPPA